MCALVMELVEGPTLADRIAHGPIPLAPDGTLMAVPMTLGSALQAGAPQALFHTPITVSLTADQYVPTADGQRFLVIAPVAGARPSPITVVVNWPALLNK